MRVLICNWVSPFDPEGRGGGVAAYERSLAAALPQSGIEAAFFNAGLAQDLRPGPVRWETIGPQHYRLVNSRPFAPGHLAFGDPAQLSHGPTEAVFGDFLARTGPWDVVHLNNLEGLPLAVLAQIRAHGARAVLMLHNYYPFCPQVNLWFQERDACRSDQGGAACRRCLTAPPAPLLRRRLALAGLDLLHSRAGPAWRAQMVAGINAEASRVLCVSERVREIARTMGLAPALLATCRIGHPDATRQASPGRGLLDDRGDLHLAYLGYLRRDKGFFFLLEALEQLPPALAARVHLILAARCYDPALRARIAALRARLAGLCHHDGYRPDDLDAILAPATLGVVPVLWEDNLPQVAMEMHLRGLALLCSDRGGAQELGQDPALVFAAGDQGAFHALLRQILQGVITRAPPRDRPEPARSRHPSAGAARALAGRCNQEL